MAEDTLTTYSKLDLQLFNPEIYRLCNLDLCDPSFSDQDLKEHFINAGFKEPRLFGFTSSTAEYLAMKWLRNSGIEIGAGRYPTKLFGNASAEYADTDGGEAFGSEGIQHRLNIDELINERLKGKFDFAIASHVLEHSDGIIRAILNMLDLVKSGGRVYFVVPDRTYLEDAKWMPFFDFKHHQEEYEQPGIYDNHHDDLALSHMKANAHLLNPSGDSQFYDENDCSASGGQISIKDLGNLLQSGDPKSHRFILHKHTYDFDGWVSTILQVKHFLENKFKILEIRYGMERFDVHFVLEKS